MNYPEHTCRRDPNADNLPALQMVTCGACFASWCERCDPAPSALCHCCNGRGYSLAPIPPRQRRALGAHYPSRRAVR